MTKPSILKLMKNDHEEINGFIDKIEKNKGNDFSTVIELFNEFEWKLEKHIFIEEQAIFSLYFPINISEKYAIISELLEEHLVLLELLLETRTKLLKEKKIDLNQLKKIIANHITLEEHNLYPLLDKELKESEKLIIIKRIKEIQ